MLCIINLNSLPIPICIYTKFLSQIDLKFMSQMGEIRKFYLSFFRRQTVFFKLAMLESCISPYTVSHSQPKIELFQLDFFTCLFNICMYSLYFYTTYMRCTGSLLFYLYL